MFNFRYISKVCELNLDISKITDKIEGNNAHGRLEYGVGHFHRVISGQSMSKIDFVLHQLLPRLNDEYFKTFTSTCWNRELLHYGLVKM